MCACLWPHISREVFKRPCAWGGRNRQCDRKKNRVLWSSKDHGIVGEHCPGQQEIWSLTPATSSITLGKFYNCRVPLLSEMGITIPFLPGGLGVDQMILL